MSDKQTLAAPSGPGSHPSDQAPAGLGASRIDPSRVAEIAEALGEPQRLAVLALSEKWAAGPQLPSAVASQMHTIRNLGIVEREFADMHEPYLDHSDCELKARLSACWWFRLTPLGLAVRDHIAPETPHA